MTCVNGRISPTTNTKLRLFADSGGYCSNPSCLTEIFRDIEDETVQIAEIAHVISAGDTGPRASKTISAEERAEYSNLILLCPTCHTIIDKAAEKYPVDLLIEWKVQHRTRIADAFGMRAYDSRVEVRNKIEPLLRENYYIFSNYGPMTEQRFNPESSLPAQWRRKIRTKIIPNNRTILGVCDANRALLTAPETELLEAYRQHVDDFEAKHLAGAAENGNQFPAGLDSLFSDTPYAKS
jgi:hypothetical protein